MNQVIQKHKESRYERGVQLAASGKVKRIDKVSSMQDSQLWMVESERTKGRFYEVVLMDDGNILCGCDDYIYNHGEGGVCKHIYSVICKETTA